MTTTAWSDLLEAAGSGFEALPAGDYDCQCTSAEATQSGNGKLMFKCIFTVTTGPHAGRKVWNQFVVSPENPNALGFFFQHMAAMGLDRAYFAQNPPPEHVAAALLNRVCRLTVGIQQKGQYAGRNEVSKVSSAGAVAAAGMAAGVPQALPTQVQAPMPGAPVMPVPQAPAPVMPAAPQVPQPVMPAAPQPVAQPQAPAMPVAPAPAMPVAPPVPQQPAEAAPEAPPVPQMPVMPAAPQAPPANF